ncbi:3-hydroxyacyl-ACP dehydratase FabZ family protein [Saccharothrix hoggarensis]|uniref:3-hydroxyacyl-ACP dehydratase FabZ family protein n=1 Tax=Saccharothrix hoggarensis TaxID=913853 RepID=A0ABW3QSF3_9PSEU
MATTCSPLREGVRVVEPPGEQPVATTTVTIDPDNPIFAGHYPGFPIFPGVGLVECVHRSALATAPEGRDLELAAIASTRFTGPTFPGDELTVRVEWKPDGDGWVVSAVVSSPRGEAAKVKLRYRNGGRA